MGRKVGSYINPVTKQTNWLDVDLVGRLSILPHQVTQIKSNQEGYVRYSLIGDNESQTINLIAKYDNNGEEVSSDPQKMPELDFADQFAKALYSRNTVEAAPLMIAAKKITMQGICDKMLAKGILFGNTVLSGIGFIYAIGKKVITIEELSIKGHGDGSITLSLRNCVGNVSLKNLIGPSVVFYTGNYKLEVKDLVLKVDSSDLIRTYEIGTADITISNSDEKIEHDAMPINFNDDDEGEALENFLISRRDLLDDCSTVEDTLEDRFADIF